LADITATASLCEASRQLECSVSAWLKGLDADNSARIERPIYVRIKFAVSRVLVSDVRDHAFRIDDKQNKAMLAPKQVIGNLDDLIRVEQWMKPSLSSEGHRYSLSWIAAHADDEQM
jgi:hypothetical protein